ncbi:MAG: hypothetical protein GQ470_04615 [Gammaproteobacteria bacterium]|nr:hypothetical protein [Gammaproteobacteria bacterium]
MNPAGSESISADIGVDNGDGSACCATEASCLRNSDPLPGRIILKTIEHIFYD